MHIRCHLSLDTGQLWTCNNVLDHQVITTVDVWCLCTVNNRFKCLSPVVHELMMVMLHELMMVMLHELMMVMLHELVMVMLHELMMVTLHELVMVMLHELM